MRIGILKAGQPPSDLGAEVSSYPQMIRNVLSSGCTFQDFDVTQGDLPEPKCAVDAYVITGSESAAYDPSLWVDRLRTWLQKLAPEVPLVGICFGHQIMAVAYGGLVEQSQRGWAGGLQEYQVNAVESWMSDVRRFSLPVANEDQVREQPPRSRVVASSKFCPFAALSYTERLAVSFQGHPEFPLKYAAMLIERRRRNGAIGLVEAQQALASLRQPNDCALVVSWISRFLGKICG